jgi:CheY-like chemotaxis protein
MAMIVLVEGDATLRAALVSVVAGREDQVLALESVEAGCEAVSAFMPDLVVCALRLPDGPGVDVARAVRARFGSMVGVVIFSPGAVAPVAPDLLGADELVEGTGRRLRAACARVRSQTGSLACA